MVEISLKGRTVLITGALGAIAEFVVRRLAEAGAFLILTDVRPEEEARQRVNDWDLAADSWYYTPMDVTESAAVSSTVQSIFGKFPQTDTAIGLAGGCAIHPFSSTPVEEFDRIFRFNFLGQTYFARAVLSEWTRQDIAGQMIFTSSLVASLPWPDFSAYTSAKAALEMFAKCLALEYADRHIRFNVVAPGHVAAGSSLRIYREDESYREMVDRVIPLKRQVRPQAVADAFLWLCSSLAEDVNGQVIKVDLGTSIPKVG
ncbi:MAG: SDR family oxidoreductase [Acidobacteria bacterium]|nr:SDR family oxidoreductase [Acidobacteriota bacterium]